MREITLTVRLTDPDLRAISRHDGLGGGPMTDEELRAWLSEQINNRIDQVGEYADEGEEG